MKWVLVAVSLAGLLKLVAVAIRERRARRATWRVGHVGRDGMFYEEFIEGEWLRLPLDGEMLVGPAHHVIYFPSEQAWERGPQWARGRRMEIISRIKSELRPPSYEYHGARG